MVHRVFQWHKDIDDYFSIMKYGDTTDGVSSTFDNPIIFTVTDWHKLDNIQQDNIITFLATKGFYFSYDRD